MAFRVILAAILGGGQAFVGGAVEHMVFNWVDRQVKVPASEATLSDALKTHFPQPGMYAFPWVPPEFHAMKPEDRKPIEDKFTEQFKAGPTARVLIMPTGEEPMGQKQLIGEGVTNVVAALIVSIILAGMRPGLTFPVRWIIVVLFGLFSWLSICASNHIWYRFPREYVQDELFCALFEWALAGIAIAAIVKPRDVFARY